MPPWLVPIGLEGLKDHTPMQQVAINGHNRTVCHQSLAFGTSGFAFVNGVGDIGFFVIRSLPSLYPPGAIFIWILNRNWDHWMISK